MGEAPVVPLPRLAMSWLHPGVLFGLGLVAVPVLLHFLMRQKPKKIVFPALRLVQQQRRQNVRRFRLRHLWLLLLRMAALAAVVAAVARPTLPAANYQLNLRELLTLGGVVAAGLGAYAWRARSLRRQGVARADFQWRRAKLRGWTTGLTVLALLLLVGWPYQRRVAAEITSPAPMGELDLPVAAVLVFDVSLSMNYTQEGLSRLDQARKLATAHLQEFAPGSRAAIVDSASDNPVLFQVSLGAAQSRIDALAISPVSLPLNDRVRAALALQRDDRSRTLSDAGGAVGAESPVVRDRFLRRIYVFTDLAATAWRTGGSQVLSQELAESSDISLHLVDVGDLQPRNTAVGAVRLSRQRIQPGGTLVVAADIAATGESGERQALLMLRDPQGKTTVRGTLRQMVDAGVPLRFEFPMLTGLQGPIVQGEVRLEGADPLRDDDVRSFTVLVGQAPKVLVVSPTTKEASEWLALLDPYSGRASGELRFEPVRIPPGQLGATDLAAYDVICLINVPRLPDAVWTSLGAYVERGGGLAVFLGAAELDAPSYNRAAPQQFLPAMLDVWQPEGSYRFSFDQREHGLLWRFRQYDNYGSFAAMENDIRVMRFWRVEPAAGTSVLATYTDRRRSPALLDRPWGRGRTVMFTTSVHLPDDPRARWNTLTSPQSPSWLALAFAEQMMEHLARTSDLVVNAQSGESVTLRLPAEAADREFLLQQPGFVQSRRTLPAEQTELLISDAHDTGSYTLAPAGGGGAVLSGFSINSPAGESDFTRLDAAQLNELFGEERAHVARSLEELSDDVNIANLGVEVFPLVLMLAIVVFCGEHFVANWFYDPELVARAEPGSSAKASGRGATLSDVRPPGSAGPASTPVAAASGRS